MDALPLMTRAAAEFRDRLLAEPGCEALPVPAVLNVPPDLRWHNTLLRAPTFRRAHVETFEAPGRVSVLHVCIFPHLHDPAPIYGFDMVAGSARVTGIFLDLSPVGDEPPRPRLRDILGPNELAGFATRRSPPEWGDIFSGDLLAIRPGDMRDTARAIDLAKAALHGLLAAPRVHSSAESAIAAGQTRYIAGQRRNEHTMRMLAGFVGATAAHRFITEVLFPPVLELDRAPANQMFT
jgi:phycocyanobilin:ferredoxin oxidoreductase